MIHEWSFLKTNLKSLKNSGEIHAAHRDLMGHPRVSVRW
jgi:hypothetical protein